MSAHQSIVRNVVKSIDCKTVGFFLKIGKEWRVRRESRSPFSASFQTFCLAARAKLHTQKYGLFCSLSSPRTTASSKTM